MKTPRNNETKASMDREKIKKAQDLQQRIDDINEFLMVFDANHNFRRGDGSKDIRGIVKIKTKKTISIFGTRWFGCGTLKKEIDIPFDMVNGIWAQWLHSLKLLEDELKGL
jgi:hypothetical protein